MFHNLTVVTGIQGENHTSSKCMVILRDSPEYCIVWVGHIMTPGWFQEITSTLRFNMKILAG